MLSASIHSLLSRKDARERHRLSRLQPILLVVCGVGGRLDHVKGICKSGVRTEVLLTLVQNGSMDQDQIA